MTSNAKLGLGVLVGLVLAGCARAPERVSPSTDAPLVEAPEDGRMANHVARDDDGTRALHTVWR